MDLGLTGRRALVTGASRGLGRAVARALLAEGATVVATARDVAAIAAWIGELPEDMRGRASAARLDLSQRSDIDAVVEKMEATGGVDIIVNNSGGPPPCAAAAVQPETWAAQFEMMANNIFYLDTRLLPGMVERGWGRIITIASSGVTQPIPGLALSNGIRAAVIGWSKTLSAEVAASGVTVNVVIPGRIHTDRVDTLDNVAAQRRGVSVADVVRASHSTIPAGRYGRPEEFADTVAFIASDRASYITGTQIRVDGGLIRSI
ncbi:SDR family oxidoreductase [Komagataeibacter sp. AV436]|uniref:SDR family oxidoreductase n=1 Tax=Komagataeibacter melomenusus TaxID=2766578 RepID=A0ABX2ACJ4_9PROT|nr:SDR family oxidoreductase [Komagataeibacter melomenusus]MBV1830134.1 SDR family oxidoreductase [Komagataeibacter melomenusus]NPC65559.1 SDR family oxidoreductase [Komagataeibacter melomenusus]